MGSFCGGDASRLGFIPDESVNHIVSNAAIYHLDTIEDQCKLVTDHLIRILKPGGSSLWIGWSGNDDFKNKERGNPPAEREQRWRKCLAAYNRSVKQAGTPEKRVLFDTFLEREFFGTSEYYSTSTEKGDFSVVVVRP